VNSLRLRLTFAYALALALVLGVVTLVMSLFAFQLVARPTMDAVRMSVAAARRIIAVNRSASAQTLEKRIVRAASRPGVSIIVIPNAGLHNALPPGDGFKDLPPPDILGRVGLRPQFLQLKSATIVIAPDSRRIASAVGRYVSAVVWAFLAALVVAWLFARWITGQALVPLALVTAELERFGRGDFSPRPLRTNDRSEMGRLTVAYNAAVEQVAAAFEERARVEAEMRSLLGDAGHALRTPLTVVSGFIDALDRGAVDDSSMRDRAFRALRVESARMRALVEGLMSLARLEQIENREARALSVGEAARTAIGIVREARGGDITLRLAGEDTALADPAEVHEAIVNLVENAVKYGGRTPVLVSIWREGNYVLVRVQDQGPGIPEADRTLLFQRFFRGSNSTHIEGSGLGLAIAKRAIQRCGGSIELENGGSGKTAFILRLPAA